METGGEQGVANPTRTRKKMSLVLVSFCLSKKGPR